MKKLSAILLFILLNKACLAQYSISGKVTDDKQQPLAGVTISISNQPVAISDTTGQYIFSSPFTDINLSFSHVGYLPASISIKGGSVPVVTLFRNNALLAEAIVKAFETNSDVLKVPVAV